MRAAHSFHQLGWDSYSQGTPQTLSRFFAADKGEYNPPQVVRTEPLRASEGKRLWFNSNVLMPRSLTGDLLPVRRTGQFPLGGRRHVIQSRRKPEFVIRMLWWEEHAQEVGFSRPGEQWSY